MGYMDNTNRAVKNSLVRFIAFVQAQPNGCWLWVGNRDKKGYGKFWWGGKTGRAHRFSYETFVDDIAPDLEPAHLCRTHACVNPDHLEAVTGRENKLRGDSPVGVNFRKTRCVRGHLFDAENTYVVQRNGHPQRQCKACNVARARAAYRANPQKFRQRKKEWYEKNRGVGA